MPSRGWVCSPLEGCFFTGRQVGSSHCKEEKGPEGLWPAVCLLALQLPLSFKSSALYLPHSCMCYHRSLTTLIHLPYSCLLPRLQ